MMTRILTVLVCVLTTSVSEAQLVCPIPCPVYDPATIVKASIITTTQKLINEVTGTINEKWFLMNRRLGTFTPTGGYGISDAATPPVRIYDYFSPAVWFARPLHKTLSYGGDPTGIGYQAVTIPRQDPSFMGPQLPPEMKVRLATNDLADSVIIRAADVSGTQRFASRDEAAAIVISQADTLNDTDDQGMTAIINKLNAQALIDARNAQAQLALHASMTELLMLDAKRERDEMTSQLNMQISAENDRGKTVGALTQGSGNLIKKWVLP